MSSMTVEGGVVVGGIDTHSQTHHAAVIDHVGREISDCEFSATVAGYAALVVWLRGFGELIRVGVEGTSSYGAGLARHLRQAGVLVVEVDRPDRRARRAQGKSDPIDAYAAARTALGATRMTVPKTGDGIVEAIRALRVARRGAVKARTRPPISLSRYWSRPRPRSANAWRPQDPGSGAGLCPIAGNGPGVGSTSGVEGGIASARPPPPASDHRD